jgi:hypothetical protein
MSIAEDLGAARENLDFLKGVNILHRVGGALTPKVGETMVRPA